MFPSSVILSVARSAKSNFCGMQYPSRSRIRNRAKAQAMIPGTVPCDVPKGHVTAGLSPVSWRRGICERLAQRLLSQSNFVQVARQKSTQIPLHRDTGDSPAVSCPADTTQGTVPSITARAFARSVTLCPRPAKVRLRSVALATSLRSG